MNFSQRSIKGKNQDDVVKSLKTSWLASQKLENSKKQPLFFRSPLNLSYLEPKICEKSSSLLVVQSSPCSPCFSFSTLARFDHTIFEKFKSNLKSDRVSCIRTLSSEEKLKRSQRFLFNKDMRHFSYETKLKKIEEFNKNYENSKQIVLTTRQNIYEGKKLVRQSKLRLKFTKLEIRLQKGVKKK
jgi:hypothetical protein